MGRKTSTILKLVMVVLLWRASSCHSDDDVDDDDANNSYNNKKKLDSSTHHNEEDIDTLIEFIGLFASETDGGSTQIHHRTDGLTLKDATDRLMTYRQALKIQCSASRFYTIDGKCNNLQHPLWGGALEPFVRELPENYADGNIAPRLYAKVRSGQTHATKQALPSAREVSVRCMPAVQREKGSNLHPQYNQNFMQFGQFFSHDLALTPVMQGKDCCNSLDQDGFHPHTFTGEACFPISVPVYDRRFHDCIPFNRSLYKVDLFGRAQQLSSATHFIDQSTVYGSSKEFAKSIRTFANGTLRVSDMGGFLPQDNTQKCLLRAPLHGCPVGGDSRVNVFPGLTLTHLIFHLEHNRLARALNARHPHWSDERVFQEARALVIAQTQNVIYKEYLPLVLGKRLAKAMGLNRPARYDPSVNPSIINSFMAAAFRFGHSQINHRFQLRAGNSSTVEEVHRMFFRPDKLYHQDEFMAADFMLSMMTHPKQNVDTSFAAGVADWLFLGIAGPNVSSDLPSRNVQRGRDHGLPPYLDFLNLALTRLPDLDPKLLDVTLTLPTCAAGLYRSVEDVDLYLGGLNEQPLKGALVGPTFAYLIAKQFKRLREGDRLFFDTVGSHAEFSQAQVQSIRRTSYSGLICRNLGLDKLPKQAFKMPNNKRNLMVTCDSIPDLNFNLW